jgi:glycosyltransferase involved in cell wall biosynthesis
MHFAIPVPTSQADKPAEPARTTVAILLSIYNGERYLQAQLDSIIGQTYRDWVLLWRDDGSSDGGRRIMQRFAETIGHDRCVELADTQRHIGATRSFLALLHAATSYPLISFCDQDDVWLHEKLARAVVHMLAVPTEVPALYCARKFVVNANLQLLRESPLVRRPPRFSDALVGNVASGCTVMLNRAAAGWIDAISPPDGSYHDWWSHIVVSAAGGRIIADNMPMMLYRQHGGNALGMSRSFVGRGWRACRRGPAAFVRLIDAHVAALERQRHLLPQSTRDALDAIGPAVRRGWLARLGLVCSGRLRRQTVLETLLLPALLCPTHRGAGSVSWRQAARHGSQVVAPLR